MPQFEQKPQSKSSAILTGERTGLAKLMLLREANGINLTSKQLTAINGFWFNNSSDRLSAASA